MLKLIKNNLNRYNNIDACIRFSDYFDQDVINLNLYSKGLQVDIKIAHILKDKGFMCDLVILGVNYRVLKSKVFKDNKSLVTFLNNY